MWIFTTKGFLSVVQHNSMPDHFQVKSRVIDPLRVLWPDHEVDTIDWADYRFRITIPKEEATSVLSREIESVFYTNFKDQCRDDHDYHDTLVHVWMTMYEFQKRLEA